jgi:hypothetical protein
MGSSQKSLLLGVAFTAAISLVGVLGISTLDAPNTALSLEKGHLLLPGECLNPPKSTNSQSPNPCHAAVGTSPGAVPASKNQSN